MFGLAAEPFLELLPESETASSNRIKIFQDKTGVFHCSSSNMNPMPINPDIVRQEVQVLKSDFNGRLKQVLFNAMVCKSKKILSKNNLLITLSTNVKLLKIIGIMG